MKLNIFKSGSLLDSLILQNPNDILTNQNFPLEMRQRIRNYLNFTNELNHFKEYRWFIDPNTQNEQKNA